MEGLYYVQQVPLEKKSHIFFSSKETFDKNNSEPHVSRNYKPTPPHV